MKRTIIALYIIVVLFGWGWAESRRSGGGLPWRRDAVLPAMAFADAEPTAPTFVYRQDPARRGAVVEWVLPISLRQVWKTDEVVNAGIHGASKASPAVDESGVYIGGDTGWFSRYSLDGRRLWRFRVDRADFGIHGTALLDREFVYFGAYNGLFYCLRKENGEVVWVTRLGDVIGSSPVADGDALYVASETAYSPNGWTWQMYGLPLRNGRLFKLDRRTGQLIWRSPWAGEQIHSSPTLFDEGRRVGVGANNGFYFVYDAATGRELWRSYVSGAVKGTAVADAGRLYLGTYDRSFVALDGGDGKILWKTPLSGISQTSPALVPGMGILVTGSHEEGEWVGVRAEDGRVLWRFPSGSRLSRASPLAVREKQGGAWRVWLTCEGTSLCVIRPEDGRVLGRWKLDDIFTGAPAVFQGALYLALNEDGLRKFATPETPWK